jgi:hypothetical protein
MAKNDVFISGTTRSTDRRAVFLRERKLPDRVDLRKSSAPKLATTKMPDAGCFLPPIQSIYVNSYLKPDFRLQTKAFGAKRRRHRPVATRRPAQPMSKTPVLASLSEHKWPVMPVKWRSACCYATSVYV